MSLAVTALCTALQHQQPEETAALRQCLSERRRQLAATQDQVRQLQEAMVELIRSNEVLVESLEAQITKARDDTEAAERANTTLKINIREARDETEAAERENTKLKINVREARDETEAVERERSAIKHKLLTGPTPGRISMAARNVTPAAFTAEVNLRREALDDAAEWTSSEID